MTNTESRTATAAPSEKHFKFLDNLRESGVTNMYGASPFLKKRFGISDTAARDILLAWMNTFDGTSTLAERIAKATDGTVTSHDAAKSESAS